MFGRGGESAGRLGAIRRGGLHLQQAGRLTALTIAAGAVAFYGWYFLFRGDEGLISVGVCLLQILAGLFALFCLSAVVRRSSREERIFWLLLGAGVATLIVSNLIWLSDQLIHDRAQYSNVSFILWLVEYICFLSALIYKLATVSASVRHCPYLFNIGIFMITSAAVSIHYLIEPVVSQPGESILMTVAYSLFAITSLSILFVTTILYYLLLHSREQSSMIFIILAFLVQVAGDSIYVYLFLIDGYAFGSPVDLLWQLSVSFIGVGAYAKAMKPEARWEVRENAFKRPSVFPFVNVLILCLLAASSYGWQMNALAWGLILTFLLIIGRLLVVLYRNEKLMLEYKNLAYHDPLTGLHNRVRFNEDLGACLEQSRKNGEPFALLLIDLDRLKAVNDTLGHPIGDQIIRQTADRIRRAVAVQDKLYRLGGDEFILMTAGGTQADCERLARQLLDSAAESYKVSGHEIAMTMSIGISLYPRDGVSGEDLLKHADSALNHAKSGGVNGYRFYDSLISETMKRKMAIENGLRKAIDRNQLSLAYQPKVDLVSREIVGMEALLRWRHPELGSVSPAEFIPIAEESDLIVSIGEWALRTACAQNKRWQKAGYAPLCVSVNVSVRQFQQEGFDRTVLQTLRFTGLSPQYLELEITESIMQDVDAISEVLGKLREAGVRTSIDDFGKGYSSLYVLQSLPIDAVKIDKLFVDGLEDDTRAAMVKTIIDLGRRLNLTVIAEGIENERQLQALTDHRCHVGQGYYFSKPVDAAEFERMLRQAKAI